MLQNAKNTLKVGLNDEGKLQIIDKASTNTPIDIAIYDKNAMSEKEFDFGTDADGNKISTGVKKGNIFNFNTNSSLIVDENHVDIIKDLQTMIDAVRNGNYRVDNNNLNYLFKYAKNTH